MVAQKVTISAELSIVDREQESSCKGSSEGVEWGGAGQVGEGLITSP